MQVVVVLRMVPDTAEELEVAENGNDIDREWIGFKLNEFDDHALEEAVLLKERSGAKVIAIALAGDGTDRQLQTAVARGADEAVRVTNGPSGIPDARVAAGLLKGAIEQIGADLVLTGVQTPEDVFGQLASYLGGTLGWPAISAVSRVAVRDGKVEATQEYSGGFSATFRLGGPTVLGVQTASQPPRYVSGTRLRAASGTPIREIAGTSDHDPLRVDALHLPERGKGAEMIEGNAEAVADRIVILLTQRGLVGA